MSFQPIQIGRVGVLAGMDHIDNALTRAIASWQENQRMLADKVRYGDQQKRQGLMDRQAAMAKASELWRAGDRAGAQAIMSQYGGQVEQYEVDAPKDWAPKLNQGEIDFADTLPMDRPGGPVAQQASPQQPKVDPTNFSFGGYTPPPDGSEAPDLEGLMQRALPAKGPNPIMAAFQAYQAKNKMLAQRLRGKFDDGTEWTIDPDQGRREQQAQADRAFYEASGEGTPEAEQIRAQYPQLRATYAAAGQDMNPKEVFGQFRADANADRQEAGLNARFQQQMDLERLRQQGRSDLEEQQQGGGKYKRRAGGGEGASGGAYSPKVERANKAALSSLDASTNRWAKTSGFEHMSHAYEEAERALTSLETGNPAGAAHALEKFVIVSRGGMATNAALALFQKHLSGWGGRVEGAVEEAKTGNLGPEKTENLRSALATVKQSLKDQIETKRQQFVESYFTPAYSEMKGNVEDAYTRLFGGLGYQTEYDPNAKTISLGTGQRAAASGRANPLTSGTRQGKLSSADQALAKQARERLKKDPNDAVAKQWLEHHGL